MIERLLVLVQENIVTTIDDSYLSARLTDSCPKDRLGQCSADDGITAAGSAA